MTNQKDDCLGPLTRSAAAWKRGGAEMEVWVSLTELSILHPGRKKRRVGLGELGSYAVSSPNLDDCISEKATQKSSSTNNTGIFSDNQEETYAVVHCQQVGDVATAPPGAPTIADDGNGLDDPQLCAHYPTDIHQYLRWVEAEPKRRPLPNYMEKIQPDATPIMRSVLVGWLVEVAEEFQLVCDTLYLTVSYIDLFLSYKPIEKTKLQLLGITCMLIASKHEEISPPHVERFCYITDSTYTKDEVFHMETVVLKVLHFEIGNPTTKTFLRRYISVEQDECEDQNSQLEFLASYLAELSLMDYHCVRFLPSVVAASAVFSARYIIDQKAHPWTPSLWHYTGYRPSDLEGCIHAIYGILLSRKDYDQSAIRDKYNPEELGYLSALPYPAEIPSTYFEETS